MRICGLITARGGSKGIPGKNLQQVGGLTLTARACLCARAARSLELVILSSDDEAIIAEAAHYGVSAPFRRPPALSGDQASSLEVAQHALDWLASRPEGPPEALCILQPTSPFRTPAHIDQAVDLMRSRNAGTVVSVVEVPHRYHPESLMRLDQGVLRSMNGGPIRSQRRQELTPLYARNGPVILLARTEAIRAGTFYADPVLPLLMDEDSSLDIDHPADLERARRLAPFLSGPT